MKPTPRPIPGTEVKFEMVPIPGGTFTMGSPADEPKRRDDEGPQHTVEIAPFWMGKYEVTWDEYDEFAFSLDLKRRSAKGSTSTKQPATEKAADAVTRPTPPYADETFGLGRNGQPVICITHHAAMEYCRWLSAKTARPTACRPRPSGNTPAAPAPRRPTRSATTRRSSASTPGTSRTPRSRSRSARRSRTRGACTTCTATSPSGAWTTTSPDIYSTLREGQAGTSARSCCRRPRNIRTSPAAARGTTTPTGCRSAARAGLEPEWSVQDPQRPQSIWWHTDATFVGFRVVRALEEQENLKGVKSLVVKGKGTR